MILWETTIWWEMLQLTEYFTTVLLVLIAINTKK